MKKPSFEKFRLVEESKNHFLVKHPSGETIAIAKGALTAEHAAHIRAMPKVEALADGGEVQDPTAALTADPAAAFVDPTQAALGAAGDSSPVTDADRRFFQTYDDTQDQLSQTRPGAPPVDPAVVQQLAGDKIAADDQMMADLDAAGKINVAKQAAYEKAMGMRPTPGLDATPEQTSATAAPTAAPSGSGVPPVRVSRPLGQMTPASLQTAAPASPDADPLSFYSKGFNQERAGIMGEATAQTKQGQETAKALDAVQQQMAAAQETYQKTLSQYQAESQQLENDYRKGTVNPNRIWQNMTTGNKILAGISIFLGGLGGGLTKQGGNVALDVINKAIDRDIEAQRANLDKNKNLLSLNLEKTRDLTSAAMMTQNQMLSAAKVQVETAAARQQGPLAQAKAKQLLGQIDLKQGELMHQLAMARARQNFYTGTGPINFGALTESETKNLVRLPNGQYRPAYSPEAAQEVRGQLQTISPILDSLDKLSKLGPKALIPGSDENRQAKSLRAGLVPLINENAGLKRLSEEDIKNITQQIQDPTSFADFFNGKNRSDALKQLLSDKLTAAFQNQLIGGAGQTGGDLQAVRYVPRPAKLWR